MNCKQGDLAIVVSPYWGSGTIVECLYLAPVGVNFKLPDGMSAEPCQENIWVIHLPNGVTAPTSIGSRKAYYGCVKDAYLRPINSGELDETTDTDLKLREPA